MCEVPEWKTLCDSLQVPDEVSALEDAIQAHQTLIERITQAYTQVKYSSYTCRLTPTYMSFFYFDASLYRWSLNIASSLLWTYYCVMLFDFLFLIWYDFSDCWYNLN